LHVVEAQNACPELHEALVQLERAPASTSSDGADICASCWRSCAELELCSLTGVVFVDAGGRYGAVLVGGKPFSPYVLSPGGSGGVAVAREARQDA
jgi:hypothetical protein